MSRSSRILRIVALVLTSLFAAGEAIQVEAQIKRDVLGFTQGLEQRGDVLYESTGAIAPPLHFSTTFKHGPAGEEARSAMV